ncbi:iron-sulfur cluster repair di-iron protein [Pollutibacter soli]|uniref:iron-sulfur cluster repair di-iron protein n=1 Tax=Pollutibacter soli TaxID=3034157 RepID=UPI003013B42A
MITENEQILNVTTLPAGQKHPAIFQRFDDLKEGESFTIHNDHDPKPLYYQLLGRQGNIFTWNYLEEGPESWKVIIGKKNADERDETIGEIAAKDLAKVRIFKKYGLDFCCGGRKTVKEACMEKGIDVVQVERDLTQTSEISQVSSLPYNQWKADFLVDFIINTHHRYVRNTLPELRMYISKVARKHGEEHPELQRVYDLVEMVNEELLSHMMKEETVLFPYIKELVTAGENKIVRGPFGSVENPISVMEKEHESAGEALSEIRALTSNYTLPEGACASFSVLYRILEEFENDLHIHVHLENNILFPKAIALEKESYS